MVVCYRIINVLCGFLERSKITFDQKNCFLYCISSLNGIDQDAKFLISFLNWLI